MVINRWITLILVILIGTSCQKEDMKKQRITTNSEVTAPLCRGDWTEVYSPQTFTLGANYSWVNFEITQAGTAELRADAVLVSQTGCQGVRWEFIGETTQWNNLEYYYSSVDDSEGFFTYWPMWNDEEGNPALHELSFSEPGTLWVCKYDYFTHQELICIQNFIPE